jgi:glycosyltransferase involved in cell wall biosynthesis
MPKLIYLYTTGGACGDPQTDTRLKYASNYIYSTTTKQTDTRLKYASNYIYSTTTNRYATAATTDGMIKLFSELPFCSDHVDTTEVFIDSVHSPGLLELNERARIHVVPTIWLAMGYIEPGDFVIIRGGFRNWLPFIKDLHTRRANWIMFYRANTNHGHWPFWDVTLNDLIVEPVRCKSGLHVPFNKPVNPDIFGYIDSPNQLPRDIDVMIGASHIHNKKGQHRTIQTLREFKAMYGYALKAVLPGGFIRSSGNDEIRQAIDDPGMNIEFVNAVPRPRLALLMNRTKVFVHGGIGGQNDRGPLEARACGCYVLLANPASAAPFLRDRAFACYDPYKLAVEIHDKLQLAAEHGHCDIAEDYVLNHGLYSKSLPQMSQLINRLYSLYPGDVKSVYRS